MSTTTRARYWAIGSVIGLSLALPGPTHASQLDADAYDAIIVAQAGPEGEQDAREKNKRQQREGGPSRGEGEQRAPRQGEGSQQRGQAAEGNERPGRGGADNRKQAEGEQRQRGAAPQPGNANQRPQGQAPEGSKDRPGRGGADSRKQAEGEQRQRGAAPQPGNANQRPQGQAAEGNERPGRGGADNRRQADEQRQREPAQQPNNANQRQQGQAAEGNERPGRGGADNRRQADEQRQREPAQQPNNANQRQQGQATEGNERPGRGGADNRRQADEQRQREPAQQPNNANQRQQGQAAEGNERPGRGGADNRRQDGDQRQRPGQQGQGTAGNDAQGRGGDRAQRHGDRPDRPRGAPSEGRKGRDGNIAEIRKQRREHREADGRVIIEEPGNRRIIRDGKNTIIRHDDSDRFSRNARNVDVQRRNGERVTTVTRKNGNKIITIEDDNGRLLRRTRRGSDGRDVVLIDNHRHRHHHRGGGGGGLSFFLDLALPTVHIDRRYYVVDADGASEDDLYEALIAPPIMDMDRPYSLDEVRYNYPLRARMRSVNLNTINFELGSWELDDQAFDQLDEIAHAMKRALDRNPDEIFLIEGHTDAVGGDEDNLTLSDRRAESVAIVLTDDFDIPAENLTTQGYGEQYLLVETPEAERRNRRVTLRRITPLLGQNR